MSITDDIKREVIAASEDYKIHADDKYDFWSEHIKYVYNEAVDLAYKYNADVEIVSLGALLHDIALIKKVGTRAEHHVNGALLAEEILEKHGYPKDRARQVIGCVYNHRSSRNAVNNEELCVADADILAHFDNIPMIFNSAYNRNNIRLCDVRECLRKSFKMDFDDLSDRAKTEFKDKYDLICKITLGE